MNEETLFEKAKKYGSTSIQQVETDATYAFDGRKDVIWRSIELLLLEQTQEPNMMIKFELIKVKENSKEEGAKNV